MKPQEIKDIFLTYYGQLFAFANHYLHDRQAAEDVVQDVFCRLLELRDEEPDDIRSMKSYLYQCTRNKTLDYLKGLHIRQNLEDNAERNEKLDEYVDNLLISRVDGDYDYHLLIKTVDDIIATFPPRTKSVFLLSRVNNLSNKEIAEHYCISVKAVEKHITKALSILREGLIDGKIILPLYGSFIKQISKKR
jgi:RNA polymerase sigma-70 factor (ECF subfamily)